MTPESQRIAIAEACGWNYILLAGGRERCWFGSPERISGYRQDSVSMEHKTEWNGSQILGGIKTLPDYLTDLNAMHEAEKVLTMDQQYTYGEILAQMVRMPENFAFGDALERKFQFNGWGYFAVATMTCEERAEAFLRAIGKWDDSQ